MENDNKSIDASVNPDSVSSLWVDWPLYRSQTNSYRRRRGQPKEVPGIHDELLEPAVEFHTYD